MKRIRVRYPNGYEIEYGENVANILLKRGSVKQVRVSQTEREDSGPDRMEKLFKTADGLGIKEADRMTEKELIKAIKQAKK